MVLLDASSLKIVACNTAFERDAKLDATQLSGMSISQIYSAATGKDTLLTQLQRCDPGTPIRASLRSSDGRT
jgi:hypothetical protein